MQVIGIATISHNGDKTDKGRLEHARKILSQKLRSDAIHPYYAY